MCTATTSPTGNFIADQDVTSNGRVIALGANIATALFPDTDPIGKTVRVNNIAFQVVGVMEVKGGIVGARWTIRRTCRSPMC